MNNKNCITNVPITQKEERELINILDLSENYLKRQIEKTQCANLMSQSYQQKLSNSFIKEKQKKNQRIKIPEKDIKAFTESKISQNCINHGYGIFYTNPTQKQKFKSDQNFFKYIQKVPDCESKCHQQSVKFDEYDIKQVINFQKKLQSSEVIFTIGVSQVKKNQEENLKNAKIFLKKNLAGQWLVVSIGCNKQIVISGLIKKNSIYLKVLNKNQNIRINLLIPKILQNQKIKSLKTKLIIQFYSPEDGSQFLHHLSQIFHH